MVEFTNGFKLVTQMSLADMHKAFQRALDKNTLFDVKDTDGEKVAVNPFQILLFREVDEETAAQLVNGARPREAATA